MMKILNVFAVLALLGSATAAYSVKYETILMAEKLKKREAERGREQHAVAILKAEWHLLNRPQRLTKIAPPEQGMQMMTARQIVRAIDIPQNMREEDMIAKALDGTLTGSLASFHSGSVPTPDTSRKSTGRTPENPINKVISSTLVKNQSKKETTPQMGRSSPTALPMSLTSNALGSKTMNTPQTRPITRPIPASARSAEVLLPPKSVPLAPKASAQIPMR